MQVTGTTTTAFVQINYGALYAADDTFDRIRVRGVAAHDVFERCRSKQIEASSVHGSIVYDGGSFDPGLARFESMTRQRRARRHVARAARRPVARRPRLHAVRPARPAVEQRGEGSATAMVGGGGPLVNAISGRGNVYLYDGTLSARRAVSAEWRPVHQLFNAHRRANPRGDGPPRRAPAGHGARLRLN